MAEKIIGEIFDKEFANKEFGDVEKSVEVKNETILDIISKTQDYVMFNIETDDLRALDGKRDSIIGSAKSDEEVFYKLSVSKVKELLEKGENGTSFIEMRPKTLTITNGNYTLEKTYPCPPFCG